MTNTTPKAKRKKRTYVSEYPRLITLRISEQTYGRVQNADFNISKYLRSQLEKALSARGI